MPCIVWSDLYYREIKIKIYIEGVLNYANAIIFKISRV